MVTFGVTAYAWRHGLRQIHLDPCARLDKPRLTNRHESLGGRSVYAVHCHKGCKSWKSAPTDCTNGKIGNSERPITDLTAYFLTFPQQPICAPPADPVRVSARSTLSLLQSCFLALEYSGPIMSDQFSTFTDSAKSLARNPIGIIALFIVLIYGFASLVTSFSGSFTPGERFPLICFLVCFPVLVLGTFGWLVSKHHNKLYAPSDFKDETLFVSIVNQQLANLKTVSPLDGPTLETEVLSEQRVAAIREAPLQIPHTPSERSAHRDKIYEDTRGYFIVHVIEISRVKGQKYDVFIYIAGRKEKSLDEIESADFFFGRHWGNRIFKAERSGKYIGVRTSAYGAFLCTCKLTFKDGASAMIYRYIDFEMGKLFTTAGEIP